MDRPTDGAAVFERVSPTNRSDFDLAYNIDHWPMIPAARTVTWRAKSVRVTSQNTDVIRWFNQLHGAIVVSYWPQMYRRTDDGPTEHVFAPGILLIYLQRIRGFIIFISPSPCIRSVHYSPIGCHRAEVARLNCAWRHIYICSDWRPSSSGLLDVIIFNAPRAVTTLCEWRHPAPVCPYI